MIKEKINALRSAIKCVFAELKSIETSRGPLYYEAEEIAVGIEVYTEDGAIAEGEYIAGDKKIKVENGVVVEIEVVEPEPAEEPVAEVDMACGDKKKMEEEPKAEKSEDDPTVEVIEAPEMEPEMEPIKESEVKKEDIDGINARIDELMAMVTAFESRLADIEKKPECGLPKDSFHKVSAEDNIISGLEAVKAMRKRVK